MRPIKSGGTPLIVMVLLSMYTYLSSQVTVCMADHPGCFRCDATETYCIECYAGYTLVSPDCVSTAVAICMDPNCATCDATGTCTMCMDLFVMDANGACVTTTVTTKCGNGVLDTVLGE